MPLDDYITPIPSEVKDEDGEKLTSPLNWVAVMAILVDVALFSTGEACALIGDAWWIKLPGAVLAGTAISTMFILGHDAAHNALFSVRSANRLAGRFLFLPCLHNPTLWIHQHNLLHHQDTNVRGQNSFSPLGPDEFAALSRSRQWLERLYRHPVGFGVYYLVQRWWKHKLFPTIATPVSLRTQALRDFRWIVVWLLAAVTTIWWSARTLGHSPGTDILWALVAPFYVWNHLMGFTAFVQHTHPSAPWFRSAKRDRNPTWQVGVTVQVKFPKWYDWLSHNIMHHPAHHLSPRSPWYRLPLIDQQLERSIGDRLIVERISVGYLLNVARACKLFNYEQGCWTDFGGRKSQVLTRVAFRG